MDEIKKGDTVRLNSGGPLMIVELNASSSVLCAWRIDGKPHEGAFRPEDLRLVERGRLLQGFG